MNKAVYILVLLISFNFSCKKERKETVVDGIVRDFVTGNPLAGVEVYLQQWDGVDHFHLINETTFLSAITGSDGKFHFEFRALKKKFYGLEYQKPSECYYDEEDPKDIFKGQTNNLDVKLLSYTNLNIHVKNVAPYDINDNICFSVSHNITGCTDSGVTGMVVDYITPVNYVKAYDKLYIHSFVTKNSILTVKLDSIVFSPCTPVTYNLFY